MCARGIASSFFVFTLLAVGGGLYGLWQVPLDAVPDLSDVQYFLSHRLDGLGRALAGPYGGSGNVSDLHGFHLGAEGEVCARRVDVRKIVCLCHL